MIGGTQYTEPYLLQTRPYIHGHAEGCNLVVTNDHIHKSGTFVELETVVTDQTDAQAHGELQQLAEALQLQMEDSVPEPYVTLLGR